MSAPTFRQVDNYTADLLDLIQDDWRPFAESDRNTIAKAIRDFATSHHGHVSPNGVRRILADLPVHQQPKPQRVGPVYRALVLAGHLSVNPEWETSDDLAGRNSGKPHRTYTWIGAQA